MKAFIVFIIISNYILLTADKRPSLSRQTFFDLGYGVIAMKI